MVIDVCFPGGEIGERARDLFTERNTCTDARVEEIDRELIRLLYLWTRLEYDTDGGCDSLFAVDART